MFKPRTLTTLLVALSLTGCAGQIKQVKEETSTFAQAGLDFVHATRKVTELSQRESLSFSAEILPSLPRTETVLQAQSDRMRERLELLERQRHQLDLLERYFGNLANLAKVAGSSKTEQVLADLMYAMRDLLEVTRKESSDYSELAVDYRGASSLSRTLQKDGPVIEATLLNIAKTLGQQAQWLELRDDLNRTVKFREEVQKPFLTDKNLSTKWKKAWIDSVNPPPSEEAISKARQAAYALLQAWREYATGEVDTTDMALLLNQLNQSLLKAEASQ